MNIKKHSYSILVGFVALSLVGALLAVRLSVRLEPSRSGGNITVGYSWSGASPELIERQVTSRLEGAFSMVQGIRKVSSESGYNYGNVTLVVDKKANLDELRFEVATAIRQLYPQFPKEVSYPSISLNNPNDNDQEQPLFTLQLNGAALASGLQQYAEEQLSPRLSATKGVYMVQAYGGNRLEYVVGYDLARTQALGIKEQDIVQALQAHLSTKNLGIAQLSGGHQIAVTLSEPQKNMDWGSIVIKKIGQRLVRLQQIATVKHQEQPTTNYYRINGQNAVNIVITADANANQLSVADELRGVIEQLKTTLPPTYNLRIEYDATEYIRENLNQIGVQSGLAVLILLVFVWLTSRSWRYTLLISISMVVNLLLAAILFYVFKIEIHLYSLAALTTSLGIIIDNVIVMIDHYQRHRNLKVFLALLGATLTTSAGLVVLWFLPDEIRHDLWDFALVLVITLGVSLVVALFFVPAFLEGGSSMNPTPTLPSREGVSPIPSYWGGLGAVHRSGRLINFLLRFRKTAIVAAVLLFGLPVFMLPTKLEEDTPMSEYYNAILGNEWYVDNIKPLADKWLGGTLRLFVNYVYEGSYFTKPERTALYVVANLPNQSTIEQMNGVLERFERQFAQYTEIDRTVVHVHNGQEGSMVVYFKPEAEKGSFPYMLKNRAIALSTEMSGISWDIYGVGQGFNQNLGENETPSFRVTMSGYNYDELGRQANRLKVLLEKHPRIQQVNTNRSPGMFSQKSLYEYVLQTNNANLALKNIGKNNVYDDLADQNAQPIADNYAFVADKYTPIKVVPSQAQHFDIWQLNQQPLPTDSSFYRFKDFATIGREKVTPEIHKEDQQYIRLVSFEYYGSSHFGQKFLDKTLKAFQPTMPIGYTAKDTRYNWWNQESSKQYGLIGLVMVLIYIICAIIFESLRQPFALIMLIPLSFVGVFLSFYWFDINFDQGGYASFVLLSGNVVCAGIFIIAEYNSVRQQNKDFTPIMCYLQAFQHKIVPILLTVLSTVLGLLPFLVYGQNEAFWFALGVGTIGGLLMSLIVIVLYLPLFLLQKTK